VPVASLFYDLNGNQKKIDFALPIFSNKFIEKVDMPLTAFEKIYSDYTNLSNANYFKIDSFINNPAP
jgi:AP-2 complex subunit alpha